MGLDDAEILIGKLALGREYLTREDALRVVAAVGASARSGRRETFSAAAVRLGYVENRRMSELADLLRTGELVCRGACGRRVPLAGVAPADAVRCRGCGGPVYARRVGNAPERTARLDPQPLGAADGAAREAAPEAPVAAGGDAAAGGLVSPGRRTVLDLSVPDEADLAGPATPVPPVPLPTPVPVRAPVPAPVPLPPAGPKSTAPGVTVPSLEDVDATRDWEDGAERTAEMMPSEVPGPGDATWRSSDEKPVFEPIALGPDLQLLAPIGRGGMGSVFRGRRADGRIVAVKILGAPPIPEVLSRFEREVHISAKLDHPNIVKVLGSGTVPVGPDAGRPYFVMDYVAGRDLAAWLTEAPRSLADIVGMVRVLCAAMEHAHSRGVIHRDLKPGNILVRQGDDQPMICDFGLAKFRAAIQDYTQHTNTGEILGTPSYMPKEQALGHHKLVGPPTDVYALGAVLYHLVTGRPPFLGASAFLTIAKVVREMPESPRALNPQVSPALEAIILKALAKEPRDRFPTCGELGRALAALKL